MPSFAPLSVCRMSPRIPGSQGDVSPSPGKRILVVGTSGCGKTTVAKRLAEELGLEYVCNDELIWGPQWSEVPRAERPVRFEAATRGPRWVLDGNLVPPKDPEDFPVLDRADTVVWLDLPRHVVMGQVTWRTARRVVTREPLWHGNVESLRTTLSRDSILLWAWTSYTRRKQRMTQFFSDPEWTHLTRIRLTSRRQVNAWLDAVSIR